MRVKTGATGFELLIVLVVMLAGLLTAVALGESFGLLGYATGFPIGCVVTFGAIYGLIAGYALIEAVVKEGIPYLPPCRRGICKSGLLTDFGDFEPEEFEGQFGYFRCKCGDLNERQKKKDECCSCCQPE